MKGGDETDPLVLRSGPPPLAAKQTCTDRGGSLSPATTNLVLASDGVLLLLLSLLLDLRVFPEKNVGHVARSIHVQ